MWMKVVQVLQLTPNLKTQKRLSEKLIALTLAHQKN